MAMQTDLDDAALRPLRFSLLIRSDVASSARAATFIGDSMKAIGVLMDVTPLTAAALAVRRQKSNYDAIYDRIEMRDTDPAMNLDFWLSSGARRIWAQAPSSPPADWERQIDQLMMKHASTFDRTERLQSFVDAQKLVPAAHAGDLLRRAACARRDQHAHPQRHPIAVAAPPVVERRRLAALK